MNRTGASLFYHDTKKQVLVGHIRKLPSVSVEFLNMDEISPWAARSIRCSW